MAVDLCDDFPGFQMRAVGLGEYGDDDFPGLQIASAMAGDDGDEDFPGLGIRAAAIGDKDNDADAGGSLVAVVAVAAPLVLVLLGVAGVALHHRREKHQNADGAPPHREWSAGGQAGGRTSYMTS